VYFMSTACGCPQVGVWLMWTHVDSEEQGQKFDFFVDAINGWPLKTFILAESCSLLPRRSCVPRHIRWEALNCIYVGLNS